MGWMADTLAGLACLHHASPEPVLHRDVKLENMLVFGNGVERVTVKLGDFGLAKAMTAQQSFQRSDSRTTVMVSPSEVLFDGLFSPASDMYMWAVSMCMLVIEAFGEHGLHAKTQTAIKEAGLQLLRPCAPAIADLLAACLTSDPRQRPCSTQARDVVMAASGAWPALGTYGGCAFCSCCVRFPYALRWRGCVCV